MMTTRHLAQSRSLFAVFVFIAALTCTVSLSAQSIDDITLNVYKDINCGCCVGWIDHMQDKGFASKINHPRDLNNVKHELGVLPEWQSCHTAVTKEGYVFEGHVPAKFIEQFLAAPPEGALGLAVPGMPLGSPGMEMGNRFTPYDIVLMNKDGSSRVFAHVESAAAQK
jgi:hypothetical protein